MNVKHIERDKEMELSMPWVLISVIVGIAMISIFVYNVIVKYFG